MKKTVKSSGGKTKITGKIKNTGKTKTTTSKSPKNSKTANKKKSKNTGLKILSDKELLEQLLKFTAAYKNPKELANKLINKFKSLNGVLDAHYFELIRIENLGRQSAILLNFTRDLITCYRYYKMKHLKNVFDKKELYNYCLTHWQDKRQEFFEVLFLNSRMKLISSEVISDGNIDNTSVSPRKILEFIFKYDAKYIICVHNHPSGDPSPSAEDIFTTNQLQAALEEMSVYILDHIIVGAGKVYSMYRGSYIKYRK